MAAKTKRPIHQRDIKGLKYFRDLNPLLDRLHDDAIDRDVAGNPKLHFDQYTALLLLYFFNPILTSLRGIQQASTLSKIQHQLGCEQTSLGSLSEAARVFDPDLLHNIITELAGQAKPVIPGKEAQALKDLTAVDGTLLPALPKMAWALWVDDTHRAAKLHLQFDVLKGVPVCATVTEGNGSETKQLRGTLQPDRFYVIDRGYAEYQLFQDIVDRSSHFVGRIRNNAVWQVVEERTVSAEAKAAGVLRDRIVWLGCAQSESVFKQTLRIVEVATGKTDSQGRPEVLLLATDRTDLEAELIALAYKYRWAIELFFRWFKCILGCKHLLSTSRNGVTIEVYVALIASLLISVWTGKKPTKRTFEMLQLYFSGWASEAELLAHIAKLHQAKKTKPATARP
ncbi:MAG: IS4 family transposase [Gemmataceae bacterium]